METDDCCVVVLLEDGDILTNRTDADTKPALNDRLLSAQTDPVEQGTPEEESGEPVRHKRNKRSLIWRHYERLDSLSAARCRICMKKLQCSESGSTSNLHRHMSKRHPEVFSRLVADGQKAPQPHTYNRPGARGIKSKPPETDGTTKKRLQGVVKDSRGLSAKQRRVFRREEDLITALRRAQKEEAQALEDQRELLEKLRAAHVREAAAEREQIESLRKEQLEEAEDLRRQREELQRERAELQKEWEELRQERH